MPLLNKQQIEHLIRQKAPKMAQELEEAGSLAAFVDEKAAELEEVASETYNRLISQRQIPQMTDYQSKVQALNEARATAQEVALSQTFEFPTTDDETTE